ncbi:MAG: hypothetical protein GY698_17405 [Actinomycetia bacterium]|nr:hypothetical protein [Actinomycetes bacterium]
MSTRQGCRGQFDRAEPDDDINYSVLSLLMLEEKGADLATADVARAWLRYLPGGIVFTAERSALVTLLQKSSYGFPTGAEPGFDLAECSDNEFNHWIGAQIRADLYGWVLPGHPDQAADLARRDAELSHRGEGVYGAMAVAAIAAALPEAHDAVGAVSAALDLLPATSDCADAMRLALEVAASGAGPGEIHRRYDHLSPVHTVNNLALVVWGLVAAGDDFGAAVGDTVAAGWDTDCNAATVGCRGALCRRRGPSRGTVGSRSAWPAWASWPWTSSLNERSRWPSRCEEFEGRIGSTIHESEPWWPDPVVASPGTLKVVFVVFDDDGFGDFRCFGSEIHTPVLDNLARQGSPLHELPHHRVGMGTTSADVEVGDARTPAGELAPRYGRVVDVERGTNRVEHGRLSRWGARTAGIRR